MTILAMAELDLSNKRVLIREDLNVPLKNGVISSDARILAAIPTLKLALDKGAAVMVMSHLGRPTEGQFEQQYSLAPVAKRLGELLQQNVRLVSDYLDGVASQPGDVILFENIRFNHGEKNNDPALAKRLAKLCDIFVMDAFATAHRAQASTYGVAETAPLACAGPLLINELNALTKGIKQAKPPVIAIVGGSKVSTKLGVLENLLGKVDRLIIGGGIANTFLAAAGHSIGQSLFEADFVDIARQLMAAGAKIPLPCDVIVAKEFSANATATIKAIDDVADDDLILDIGPQAATQFSEQLKQAGTILWNGPVGVFEFDAFSQGTKVIAKAIAASDACSIAGGGDTLAAIAKFAIQDKISYISTGGGAFLELLEGKDLPAVSILEQRAKEQ